MEIVDGRLLVSFLEDALGSVPFDFLDCSAGFPGELDFTVPDLCRLEVLSPKKDAMMIEEWPNFCWSDRADRVSVSFCASLTARRSASR